MSDSSTPERVLRDAEGHVAAPHDGAFGFPGRQTNQGDQAQDN